VRRPADASSACPEGAAGSEQGPGAGVPRSAEGRGVAGVKPRERPRRSWNDALVRWLPEQAHQASIESDRDRSAMASGGPREPARLGLPGRGQGAQGDPGSVERRCDQCSSKAGGPMRRVRVQLSWAPGPASQHEGLVHGAGTCGHRGDIRWHDLRYTWARWHVQGGTPLFALQELGGLRAAPRQHLHRAWLASLAAPKVG
jgi:hypothetical protein